MRRSVSRPVCMWCDPTFGPKVAAMRKVALSIVGAALLFAPRGALAQEKQEGLQSDADTILKGDPNGFSSDYVGRRAAETSYQVQGYQQAYRGASDLVDQAV